MIKEKQKDAYVDYLLDVCTSFVPYLSISTSQEIANFQDKLSKGLVTEKYNYLYYLQGFRGKPLDYVGIKYMGRPLSTIAFANLFDAFTGHVVGTPEVCTHAALVSKFIKKYKEDFYKYYSL